MGSKINKMKILKSLRNVLIIILFLTSQGIFFKSQAAFDIQGVELFKDNAICITRAGSTTPEGLNLSNFTVTTESVRSKVSSSGSLCAPPPFFTGGTILTTISGIKTQADPTVQSLGRGILISEIAGTDGLSSSGDPSGFSSLVTRLGGLTSTIFEVSLPDGCDVVDDDDDIVGSSSDLSTINDFSFPTCSSTTSLTVACNATSNLLTAATGLAQATSTGPAKIRFTISEFNSFADANMIDSILIRLDSQDIFCPNNTGNSLTVTIAAKNAINNPTVTEILGSANIGTPMQAAKLSYATETATSVKGEISTNETGVTPALAGNTTTANTIQIEELNNESIPIGGQSSPTIINPSVATSTANNTVNIWLIPSISSLFSAPPATSDIIFSDNSFVVSATPYIVMSNTDDPNAPFGTLVIPIRQNSSGSDPATVKTTIKIKNLILSSDATALKDSTVSLSFFEPVSGAIVNTPGALSILSSATNLTNLRNFSSFAPLSTRAVAQNAIIDGAANDGTGANQVITDADIAALTARDTVLETSQITDFTKVISSVTTVDSSKVNITNSNSVLTITGDKGASIGGAKIKIDSLANGETTSFDSVTVTSKSDGSFNAKLKADFSKGAVTVNLKQTVSNTGSKITTKSISQEGSSSSCDKTVCGCANTNCTPNITSVLTFVKNNGGLAQIVTSGGALLQEIITSAKKALGLS